jgi:hypothetical protein
MYKLLILKKTNVQIQRESFSNILTQKAIFEKTAKIKESDSLKYFNLSFPRPNYSLSCQLLD